MLEHKINGFVYEYPSNKREPFMRWARHKESGLVDRMAKMKDWRNFHAIYDRSTVAEDVKKRYNAMFNRGKDPRKYSIHKFYDLMRTVVKLEIRDGDREVQRVSKHMNLKDLEVKVVAECPIEGVKLISSPLSDALNLGLRPLYSNSIALNYSAKHGHSAKTANETARATFETARTEKEGESVAILEPDPPPGTDENRIEWANRTFFEDIQSEEW
jgi:hypothetical protein